MSLPETERVVSRCEAPPNPPERTQSIERLVEQVIEEHSETLEKLADE